jgi:hypothetical protein
MVLKFGWRLASSGAFGRMAYFDGAEFPMPRLRWVIVGFGPPFQCQHGQAFGMLASGARFLPRAIKGSFAALTLAFPRGKTA